MAETISSIIRKYLDAKLLKASADLFAVDKKIDAISEMAKPTIIAINNT